jgi:mycothiol synthase
MSESTQTATPASPPEQLRMIWPPERLDAPPTVTIHPDYELRTFRHGSPEDLNGWVRLMELAGFGVWDETRFAPILARILPNGWFFAVHRETGVLAASAMACHEPRPLHPFGGALNWVCGDPAHRGNGLGMTVCAAVTARLLAAGYENIFLLTDDFRLPAISIYLRLGYRPLLHAPDMAERWRVVYKHLGRTEDERLWYNVREGEILPNDEESPEEIVADEALWDAQFTASQEGMKKMAEKALAEVEAGKSTPMVFTADGRIIPG